MRKIILTAGACCWFFFVFCQTNKVGINTKTPQQTLHIAGVPSSTQINTSGIYLVQPTIRVDGLNSVNNNVAKYSTSPVQPVSVTQNGDFILVPNAVSIPLISTPPGVDSITATTTVTPTDTVFASTTLKTYSFKLNQTCLVHFLASISAAVFNTSGTVLNDNKGKIYSAAFRFTATPAGSGITLNTSFASASLEYINTSTSSGGATGLTYLQPESYLVLPPGNYTVILIGQAYGNYFPFNAVYGQGPDDMISITATPL